MVISYESLHVLNGYHVEAYIAISLQAELIHMHLHFPSQEKHQTNQLLLLRVHTAPISKRQFHLDYPSNSYINSMFSKIDGLLGYKILEYVPPQSI